MKRLSAWASPWAVFEFEWQRARSVTRLIWWSVLAFFPVGVVLLILTIPHARREVPREFWQVVLFVLIPAVTGMLGTFVWTASAVSSELEGQSWIYLATRPGGRVAVLLGKYAVAVAWVLPAALASATICSVLLWIVGTQLAEEGVVLRTWLAVVGLSLLAIPAYAAVYLAIGTLFTKRSMVIAVAYTLVFELAVSFVPALINKFTVQYRLRALFIDWAGIDISQVQGFASADLFGTADPWLHISALGAYALILLAVAVWLVRKREYLTTVSADIS